MSQRFSSLRAAAPLAPALLLGLALACSGQSDDAAPAADGESSDDGEPGGQSGGEGDGEFPVGTPCACLSPLTLGRVISADGCVRVEVTGGPPGASEFAVGEVLGGIVMFACGGGAPLAAGSEIAFQYLPGEHDECPAYRACAAANCVVPVSDADPDEPSVRDTSFECNQACYDQTRAECSQPAAWQRQTGRFTALELVAGRARFDWAGETRSATLESLATPECFDEHATQLELYQASSAESDAPTLSTSSSDVREREMATMPATAYVEPGTCAEL